MNFVWAILTSVLSGFLIVLGTAMLISSKKAISLPGGSLATGISIALAFGGGIPLVVICSIFGIIGWLLAIPVLRRFPIEGWFKF